MFTFTYMLTGSGWSEATIADDGAALTLRVSYLSNALRDLTDAMIALCMAPLTPPARGKAKTCNTNIAGSSIRTTATYTSRSSSSIVCSAAKRTIKERPSSRHAVRVGG